jgi:hypothetical protein
MINTYIDSEISVYPDTMQASELYMGVILQAEPIKQSGEADEDYFSFRNTNALIDEINETTISGKIIITYGGEAETKSVLPPNATVLVTDYKSITEKLVSDISIGDNLVDGNYYQNSCNPDNTDLLVPVFVQQVEFVDGEFEARSIILESDTDWYGIYVDNIFIKYEV